MRSEIERGRTRERESERGSKEESERRSERGSESERGIVRRDSERGRVRELGGRGYRDGASVVAVLPLFQHALFDFVLFVGGLARLYQMLCEISFISKR